MPLITPVGRKRWRVRVLLISIGGALWLGVILHLFPFYWTLITSLKSPYECYRFPPTWWPEKINPIGYTILFQGYIWSIMDYSLTVYIKNSFIITGGIMAIQIPVCALVAYALSKLHRPRWNRILFLYLIGPMLVPQAISLIPLFLLLHHFPFATRHIPNIPFTSIPFPSISFINTYWAVILPSCYSAFNVLLFKGFFDGIPDELINAARLDGASELGIFGRIILPLSKPVFAVVSYFTFSAAYNSFFLPLIMLREEKFPLPVLMQKIQSIIFSYAKPTTDTSHNLAYIGIGQNALMAIAIIQSIPVFIMFIIFREQLMKGIKLRGFK